LLFLLFALPFLLLIPHISLHNIGQPIANAVELPIILLELNLDFATLKLVTAVVPHALLMENQLLGWTLAIPHVLLLHVLTMEPTPLDNAMDTTTLIFPFLKNILVEEFQNHLEDFNLVITVPLDVLEPL